MSVQNLGNFPHTVGNLDDRPNLPAAQMKAAFEADVMELWAKVVEVIPELNSARSAANEVYAAIIAKLTETVNSSSTNEKIPTAKAVYDAIADALTGDNAQTIIENWLSNHPEATTTVQDGAITYAKLASTLVDYFNERFDAVRNVEDDAYDEVVGTFDVSSIAWELGGISISTGADSTANNRLRSDSILVRRGSVFAVPSGYKLGVYMYSAYRHTTASFLAASSKSITDTALTYVVPVDGYARVVLAYDSDAALDGDTIKGVLIPSVYNYATEEIPTTYPLMRQYYNTGSHDDFDIDENTEISTTNLFSTAVVSCDAGDRFVISGAGGATARLYAWFDTNGDLIDRAIASLTVVKGVITAPSGAKTLVMNSMNTALSVGKIVKAHELKKPVTTGEKRLVDGVIMNCSFYKTDTATPRLVYESGCRTFGFHVKEGCKYTVKVVNGSSLRLGFVHDELDIKGSAPTDGSATIYLKGYLQFAENPYTFQVNGCKTAFLYGSSNTVTSDCEFIVYEEDGHSDWAEEVSKATANAKSGVLVPGLLGSPQFYLSDAVAPAYASLNLMPLSELYGFYDDLCESFPHMIKRGTDLGTDASGTFAIREYVMAFQDPLVSNGEVSLNGTINLETVTNLWKDSMRNNVLIVSSGLHGNEKTAAYGLALAIREILSSNEPWAQFIKSNFEVHIAPALNPYGFEHDVRVNANNVDINRDFFALTQPETTAIKTWLTALAPRAVAFIDSHGTSGHYAYVESGGDSKYYNGHCTAMMRFASAIQANWKSFYDGFNIDAYPYCFLARSTYNGTKRALTNELGMLSLTTETPQDFRNTGSWDNDIRSCKLTKDLLINYMQLYGEWGYRIKNQAKDPLYVG